MPEPRHTSCFSSSPEPRVRGYTFVVGEDHVGWTLVATRQEAHASPALRGTKGARVHDSIRPSVAESLKSPNEIVHRLAAFKLQHEGDVLKQYTRNAFGLKQPKYVIDEP